MSILKAFAINLLSKKQVFLRFALVWALGLFIFNFDENSSYDLRFKLRSNQPVEQSIVIINITKSDWDIASNPTGFSSLLSSGAPLSDAYFWSTPVWKEMLGNVLKDKPQVVTVDLFFDRSIPMPFFVENSFKLPKVIWRAEEDQRLSFRRPRFTINITTRGQRSVRSLLNIGLGYIYTDYDGVARRYNRGSNLTRYLKDLSEKTFTYANPGATSYLSNLDRPFINFRGARNTYRTISINTLLSGSLPKDFFKDKIVLIGASSMDEHFVRTPVGAISRTEYLANTIDNLKNNLWIKKLPLSYYYIYLFILTALCFLVLHNFRQGLTVSSLVLLSVLSTATSIILFDVFNIWLPIMSPIAIIILSYIILMNHLLSESEYSVWQALKKEESSREMNELKNNFVSLFSHDLKTPLAKIHAISDRMLQSTMPDEQGIKNEMQKIQTETKELNRYIQSILQVTRIEAGEFNLNVHPHDINGLIEDCIETMASLAASKNITIDFKQEPMFAIDMDANLIKEVFLNIIDNSIKYCPEGSRIDIATSDSDERVLVDFSDNGPGVEEQEQIAIFEKFYRSKNNPSNKKGTGLGLYLVRYFIEIHDGTVDMQSTAGQGTSFRISLPFEQKKEEI